MEKIRGKIHYHYDNEYDVLYSYINKPRKAKCLDMDNGVFIRVDSRTGKIVGFTILDYEKRKERGLLKTIPYFEEITMPVFP